MLHLATDCQVLLSSRCCTVFYWCVLWSATPRLLKITQHCARCAFSGFEPKAQPAGSRHPLRLLLRLPISTSSPCSTQLVRFDACQDSDYRYTTLCTAAHPQTRPHYVATENRTLPLFCFLLLLCLPHTLLCPTKAPIDCCPFTMC